MDAVKLRERVAVLTRELDVATERLRAIESVCSHVWGEPVYDPVVRTAYSYQGLRGCGSDPEPIMVPSGSSRKDRWRRTCKLCGKFEFTERQKTVVTAPDFG